ncbi:transposase [[Micrococcus luteus] ATCC 49442]|uniref:transposase n=1 Tax=[Micrococcus luteus] ATCC 49442 TaxID=2698727 RepID=UPI0013DB2449|nr:transposase [[Micrococcus luteus] ATCC 49442]
MIKELIIASYNEFDLRWKTACGYGLTDTAFHPSTLTYWRLRLAASKNPHRIMEAPRPGCCRACAPGQGFNGP